MDEHAGASEGRDIVQQLLPRLLIPGVIRALPDGTAEDLREVGPVADIVALEDYPEGGYGKVADLPGIADVQ